MDEVSYTPIGVIRTPFPGSKGMPKGPEAKKSAGTVELLPGFAEGLADLEGFSHVMLVFHMHHSEGPLMKVVPWNEKRHRGVFSTRSPRRPNPIGVTVVRLVRLEGNRLRFTGADMVDGTPLLDIKPYLPEPGPAQKVRTGWYSRGRRSKRRS
jgi:tRNA-Thr(GGU) m(6)t(6)A37 methyltransferase TsaA